MDTKFRRIWDVENKRKQKTVIVVKSKERGARTKVTACAYSPDGSLIGGGKPMKPIRQCFTIYTFSCSLLGRRTTYVAVLIQFCTPKHDR